MPIRKTRQEIARAHKFSASEITMLAVSTFGERARFAGLSRNLFDLASEYRMYGWDVHGTIDIDGVEHDYDEWLSVDAPALLASLMADMLPIWEN
jgi:hypothetical protein